jgi:N-acetylated-alpha-linked acidic dipeptidase
VRGPGAQSVPGLRRRAVAALLFGAAILVTAAGGAAAGRGGGAGEATPDVEAAATAQTAGGPGILGFHRDSLPRQRQIETLLLELPDRARVEEHSRILAGKPHVAGTPENEAVARYIAARFREAGLETEIRSYPVYLGYVKEAQLEQVGPVPVRLATPEDAAGDSADPWLRLNWNAYSPSCDLTREVVYVNYGRPEDFDALEALGVSVKDRIVLVRYFHGYRGGKALQAERRGAAAIIFYSDPADDGYVKGDVWPDGPWGPEDHVQRGGAVYDFIVPGDPLTPGWASVPGARRIRPEESEILPRLPSIPISGRDAHLLLKHLAGPVVPRGWQGGLPLTYHVGPGPSRVRLRVEAAFETRPIHNVIGVLRGSEEPERKVLLTNHHDAWVYGASDPISGTAAMIELARVAGDLKRRGMTPRRTLVFASVDAEEMTITGSTEWGEEHRDDLAAHAVACLNVDAAATGPAFRPAAVPTLRRLITETLRDVTDPRGGGDLLAATVKTRGAESFRGLYLDGSDPPAGPGIRFDVPGGGSDYTVFLNHLGIPAADLSFEGPYGVFHSVYDSHAWMSRHGDPGFLYQTTMVRVWGTMAYRLANAEILPFEESPYPADVRAYLAEVEAHGRRWEGLPDLADLKAALAEWEREAASLDARVGGALAGERPARRTLRAVNAALMKAERDLLIASGIPKRPWFRHPIYAPYPSYAAETLPGLREAVAEADSGRARAQAAVLAGAVRARAATLRRASEALGRQEPVRQPATAAPGARRDRP